MSQPANAPDLVHGTALALGTRAVLIRGASGSGKSDLALRCIAAPSLPWSAQRAELVSDDQVRLVATARGIEVSPPPSIAGRMEVRGLGIVELPWRARAWLSLVVDLVAPSEIARYPLDDLTADLLGFPVPLIRLAAFECSAPVKLILALEKAPGVLTPP